MQINPDERKSYEEFKELCRFYMEDCEFRYMERYELLRLEKKALMSFIPDIETFTPQKIIDRMYEIIKDERREKDKERREAEVEWERKKKNGETVN